jgi:hypothetical protein
MKRLGHEVDHERGTSGKGLQHKKGGEKFYDRKRKLQTTDASTMAHTFLTGSPAMVHVFLTGVLSWHTCFSQAPMLYWAHFFNCFDLRILQMFQRQTTGRKAEPLFKPHLCVMCVLSKKQTCHVSPNMWGTCCHSWLLATCQAWLMDPGFSYSQPRLFNFFSIPCSTVTTFNRNLSSWWNQPTTEDLALLRPRT